MTHPLRLAFVMYTFDIISLALIEENVSLWYDTKSTERFAKHIYLCLFYRLGPLVISFWLGIRIKLEHPHKSG